jgi:hypothetical protein
LERLPFSLEQESGLHHFLSSLHVGELFKYFYISLL